MLTWEALRRTPEGGVYACVRTQMEADALEEQAAALPQLTRPYVLTATLGELTLVLTSQLPNLQFDRIIGRNTLLTVADKVTTIKQLIKLLKPSGVLVLAEAVPRHAQRLYQLLDEAKLDPHLYERLVAAEEAIYSSESDAMVNWDAADLRLAFEAAGMVAQMTVERSTTQMYITSALIERWFALATATEQERPTYAQHLARFLNVAEIHAVQDIFTRSLLDQTVTWASSTAFIKVKAST